MFVFALLEGLKYIGSKILEVIMKYLQNKKKNKAVTTAAAHNFTWN